MRRTRWTLVPKVFQGATGLISFVVFQLVFGGILVAYAWQQLRVGYGQPGWLAAVKLPLFCVGLLAAHLFYRLVQFLVVFAMT